MQTPRPNILWIETDEHRVDSLGCYGGRHAHTPNLDRLAARGVRFDRHYTNAPVCVPSRVSGLTGLYPHQTGILGNEQANTDSWAADWLSFPERLAHAGYRTVNIGRTHTPPHPTWQQCERFHLFDDEAFYYHLGPDYDEAEHEVIKMACSIIASGIYPRVENGRTPASHITDRAVDWLDKQAEDSLPFFLRVSHIWPHTPVLAPEDYYHRWDPADMDPADAEFEPVPDYTQHYRDWAGGEDVSDADTRRCRATYYALVAYLDTQIGRVLDRLEQLGLAENTIVVFSSDHGCLLGEHALWTKGVFYEEATRVPLIIAAPGQLPEGAVVHGLTEQVDLAPTVLKLAGEPIPDQLPGRPLVSDDGLTEGKPAVYGELRIVRDDFGSTAPHRVWVRTDAWSFDATAIASGEDLSQADFDDASLFDLRTDPGQRNNLAADPSSREAKQALIQMLRDWLKSTAPLTPA